MTRRPARTHTVRFAASLLALLLAAGALASPARAAAQDAGRRTVDLPHVSGLRITAAPRISARAAYDDNLQFQDVASYEFLLAPALELTAESERTRLALDALLNLYTHPGHGDFDRMNRKLRLDASHGLTERFQALLAAEIVFDKSFEEALGESATVVRQRSRRKGLVSPGLRFTPTRRDALELRFPLRGVRRDGMEESNYSVFGPTGSWRHELGDRRTTTLLELGDERRAYATGTERRRTVLPGLEHAFSPAWRASLSVGAAVTDADFEGESGTERDGFTVVRARVRYKGERHGADLEALRDSIPGSDGESLSRDRIRLGGTLAITERLDAGAHVLAQRTRSAGRVTDAENVMYSLSPSLAYEWNEDTTLTMGFERTILCDRVADTRRTRNRVFVGLTWQLPEID